MFWYVETIEHEYIYKAIDYEQVLKITRISTCASLKSISVKQLMTLSYMIPELVSNEEFYQSPTGASDIHILFRYISIQDYFRIM